MDTRTKLALGIAAALLIYLWMSDDESSFAIDTGDSVQMASQRD
jgi:hypothetical protein